MKTLFAAALVLAVLWPSASAQDPQRAQIGLLVADGAYGYVNGALVKPRTKYRIHDGDHISTGPGTSLKLTLTADGYKGYIQLDEDTDPNLLVKSGCIAMQMLKGRAIINAKRICLKTPRLEGVTKSLVHLDVGAGRDELTVIHGSVELQVPVATTVGGYWRYTVEADGTAHAEAIDTAQAQQTIDWQKQYFKGMPKWLKWALGIFFTWIAYEVISDNDRPPPSAPPATEPDASPPIYD